MKSLLFVVRDEITGFVVIDFMLDGEYSGTATIRPSLLSALATSITREKFAVDIEDRREVNHERTTQLG